jgi:endonuclease/exonuclease/phosphatase family metal-dependent hydrolase
MRVRNVLVLLALALGTVTAGALPAEAGPERRSLTVMTFNIRHGEGTGGELDLERIAEVIEGQDPDAVGLQEVDRHWSERSDFVDQTSWLARRLGMYAVFGANLDLDPLTPGAPRRQYGNAILSRHPIIGWDNIPLPRFDLHEQQGLLLARIKVRGAPLLFYNTHLDPNDAAERLAQAKAIRDLIGTPEEPFVLVGDFNATPGSPPIRHLTETMTDAWAKAGVGEGDTFNSVTPYARIDYVFTPPEAFIRTAAVVTTDPGASDHLPLTADLLLPVAEERRAGRATADPDGDRLSPVGSPGRRPTAVRTGAAVAAPR